MNLEDMMKNLNPQMLSMALKQMGSMISPQQMEEVKKVIQGTNKGELSQKLNHLGPEELKRELANNPMLAKELANNPEVMKKLNQIFENR